MGETKKTVFFFGYSWSVGLPLDAYQQSIVDEFREQGFDVRVYYSNFLAKEEGQYGVFRTIENKLIEDLLKQRPTVVVSMNQGLLTKKFCKAAESVCPIFSWIVDDPVHVFYPNFDTRPDLSSLPKNVKVIVPSSEIFEVFKKACPWLDESSLFFLPFVTNPESFASASNQKSRNIVFIGSCLNLEKPIWILESLMSDPVLWKYATGIIDTVRKSKSHLFIEVDHPNAMALMKKFKMNHDQYRMFIADMISTSLRIESFRTVAPFGLEFYGNDAWISGLRGSPDLLTKFNPTPIATRSQLVELYQSSKIAIHIPQLQVGPALSYRVYDIMASDALLIQPYFENSDLYRIFGPNCPVPTYKSQEELFKLCSYYLENEEERKSLVLKCNALITNEFSFKARVQMLTSHVPVGAENLSGSVNYLNKRKNFGVRGLLEFVVYNFVKSPVSFTKRVLTYFLLRPIRLRG